eukprot:1002164_1
MSTDLCARQATHAGSWYSDEPTELAKELDVHLNEVLAESTETRVRAIIVPHAGYSYSAKTGAYAYKRLLRGNFTRVVLLGPSHHHPCGYMVSGGSAYKTPLGNIPIDRKAVDQLLSTGLFGEMSMKVDEAEHSLELCAPFIKHVLADRDFSLVPIMVGATSPENDRQVAAVLKDMFLDDERTVFVISSDFCHWGSRFDYQFHEKSWGTMQESIEKLNKLGREAITTAASTKNPPVFYDYLDKYQNTICGQHPISILLQMLGLPNKSPPSRSENYTVSWPHISNSGQVENMSDSSVSYAAGVVTATAVSTPV